MKLILLATLSTLAAALAVPERPISDIGGRCEGATFPSPICDPSKDLTCVMPEHPIPGAAGTCYPLVYIDQPCGGGSVRYPPVCASNAKCVLPDHPRPGQSGKCVEVRSGPNEECGGGARDAKRCGSNLFCMDSSPGHKGYCYKPWSG